MITNFKEALEHFFTVDMLNEKGLREYANILKQENTVLRIERVK